MANNILTQNDIQYVDYKDVELLKKLVNRHGKIVSRRKTNASGRSANASGASVTLQ